MRHISILDRMLDEASMLHSHVGPFLALGVKAGLRAIEVLGYDPFEMRARIMVPRVSTPYTCFADGVQYATGCTLGKLNIEIFEGGRLEAVFTLGSRRLVLRIKESILAELARSLNSMEEDARRIMRMSLTDLFEEELVEEPRPPPYPE
jgi:formylmethanofuran dehydrogenase subunit E